MGLFSSLNPFNLLGGGGGGNSSFSSGGAFNKTSENTNQSTTQNTSNSGNYTLGNGAFMLREGATYDGSTTNEIRDFSRTDNSQHWTDSSTYWADNSTAVQVQDSSSRDYSQSWTDNSQRSVTDSRDLSTWLQVNDSSSRDYSQQWSDSRNQSTTINDSANRSFWQDLSSVFNFTDSSSRDYSQRWEDRSSTSTQTTITNTGTDAARIVELNAALLQAVGEDQGETVRLISRMGADSLATAGAAATNLFATSSAEASRAWGLTLDKAGEVLEGLFATAGKAVSDTTNAAESVAARGFAITPGGQANTSTDNTMKLAAIGAAVVLGAIFLTRKA